MSARRYALGAIYCAIGLAVVLWFSAFDFRSLMGDDLNVLAASNTKGGYASEVFRSFTQTGDQKYRPILTVVLSIVTDAFGNRYVLYKFFNMLLLSIAISLAAYCSYYLSKRRLAVAVFVSVALVTARFNLYYVLQGLGIMENLALCFMLIVVICGIRYHLTGSRRYLYLAYLTFTAAIYTHERYLVLLAFCVAVTVLSPHRRSWLATSRDVAIPLVAVISNYVLKVHVFHVHFLTGGGGQEIDPRTGDITAFMWRAVLNCLGYNSGPDYLSGRNAHSLGTKAVVIALAFAVPVLALVATVVVRRFRCVGVLATLRLLAYGSTLFVPLILSASITFRQEYRWLYPPFVVMMLGLAWCLGELANRQLRNGVTYGLLATSLAVALLYRPYFDQTYFFSGQETADSVRDRMIEQYRDILPDVTMFLIMHDAVTTRDWVLGQTRFFSVYAPGVPFDVRLIDDEEQVDQAVETRDHIIIFDYRGRDVVEVANYSQSAVVG